MIDKEMIERIDHLFKTVDTMSEEQFTEVELHYLESFERQFKSKRWLSERQFEILEDIVRRAKER
jgi:hypothetical protein